MRIPFLALLPSALLVCMAALSPAARAAAPVSGYAVVATLPHLTSSFTEGFFYQDGLFYEGTGRQGQSALLVEDPATGRILQRHTVPPQYFGEGIVAWRHKLYEWTWQSHIGWIYDQFSLRPLGQFTYTGEGWGMTHDTRSIITSDGTDVLRFRDPATFRETRHITVRDGSTPVYQLNELEYIHGEIYANIWHSDRIARISPRDGRVLGWIDLTGLLPQGEQLDSEAVLNGIAWDPQHDRLYVTGKEWPHIYQIKVLPPK